mgnify:CR=1 FL=1
MGVKGQLKGSEHCDYIRNIATSLMLRDAIKATQPDSLKNWDYYLIKALEHHRNKLIDDLETYEDYSL